MISYQSHNYQAALGYLREAIAGNESIGGPDHPGLIVPLCNLALTHFALKQRAAAEVALRRALAICDARFGQGGVALSWILISLAELRRKAGDMQEAKTLEIRAKRVESESGTRSMENSLVHVTELMDRKRR